MKKPIVCTFIVSLVLAAGAHGRGATTTPMRFGIDIESLDRAQKKGLDGQLAEVAGLLRRRGNVNVVLGFGNWGREHWTRFDRAAEASDFIGTELLRSSVRDQLAYGSAVSTLIDGARHVQAHFNKPSLVSDLAPFRLTPRPATKRDRRRL